MQPDAEALLKEFESIRQDADSLTATLTPEQFLWRPGTNKWSVAECLAHLVVVDSTDIPGLRSAIASARAQGLTGRGPFKYGRISGWFVQSMEPPVKRFKVSAPGAYQPALVKDPLETRAEFLKVQAEVREVVRSADGLGSWSAYRWGLG